MDTCFRRLTNGIPLRLIGAAATALLVGAMTAQGAPVRSLYSDPKASQVGDLLTIIVIESTQASRSASTQTSKTNSIGFAAGIDTKPRGGKASGSGSTQTALNGAGTTRSSGELTTTVTALVTEVLPNGYLKVEGSRELTINNEKETLRVSGICRTEDIQPDNVLLSNQLANPSISYTGDGWIAKQQKPNIVLRLLASILPFF